MKTEKVLSLAALVSAVLCLLFLIWNDDKVTCGTTTARMFETMFFIVSLGTFKLYSDCKWSDKEE